ncbi:ankyrin repeat domain-containing protein [Thiolapillus sp.]
MKATPTLLSLVFSVFLVFPAMASDVAEAGSYGNLRVLQRAVEKGESLEVRDEDGSTALNNAVTFGKLKAVSFLLEHGAQIHTRDSDGSTPLHNLTVFEKKQDVDIARLLLSHGADLNARDKDGSTPLQLAVSWGRTSLANFLLDYAQAHGIKDAHGVPLLEHKDADGSTLLHDAVSVALKRQQEMVKLLLAHGANVNAQDDDGSTPLAMLTPLKSGSDIEVAKLLLEKGADINTKDSDGDTPLHDAVMNGRDDLVSLFLKRGADVHARNHDGKTPLFWVCEIEDIRVARKIVDMLLEKGARINARDNEGDTLGIYTNCAEDTKLMKYLYGKGLTDE